MEDIEDVVQWLNNTHFIVNPLVTIIVKGGIYNALRILAILIMNEKNINISSYSTKNDFINYLRS